MMKRHGMALVGALAVLALAAPAAWAGGLFVPGTGTQGQARAGAFVAKADDPSALYYNPAGFSKGTGTIIHIGINLVDYSLSFTRAGSYDASGEEVLPYAGQAYDTVSDVSKPAVGVGGFQAVPLISVSTDLGMKNLPVRFGFGLMAPQAYPERSFAPGYQFEETGTPPPPQRYDTVSQQAATIMPSVAVSYSVSDKLDVGVRGTWGIGSLKATSYVWGVRNYEEWVGYDAIFKVDVKDSFVPSFGIGGLYRPSDSFEVGFSYNSAMTIDAKGEGYASQLGAGLGIPGGDPERILPVNDFTNCAKGGTDLRQKACIKLSLPMIATIGGRWILRDKKGGERADVELDVRWENWSAASDYEVVIDGKSFVTNRNLEKTIIRHGLQDVISVRLGGSYTIPVGANALTFRGGAAYDTAAAPTSWNRVDFDGAARTTLGTGLAFQTNKFRIDVGGGVVLEGDRTVATCNPTATDQGCSGTNSDASFGDRTAPDPAQPLQGPKNGTQSPFNGGDYSSGYILLSLGVTTWF